MHTLSPTTSPQTSTLSPQPQPQPQPQRPPRSDPGRPPSDFSPSPQPSAPAPAPASTTLCARRSTLRLQPQPSALSPSPSVHRALTPAELSTSVWYKVRTPTRKRCLGNCLNLQKHEYLTISGTCLELERYIWGDICLAIRAQNHSHVLNYKGTYWGCLFQQF